MAWIYCTNVRWSKNTSMCFEAPALIRMDLFCLLLLSKTTPIILGSLTEMYCSQITVMQNKLAWISHIILEWLITAVWFLWDESDYNRPPFCSRFGTCVVICCGKMSQNMIIKFELRKSNSLSSITQIFSPEGLTRYRAQQ